MDPSDRMHEGVKTIVQDNVSKYDTSPVRVALFGLGRIGMIHLEKIYSNPRTKLVYCVETIAERQRYVQTAWYLDDVTFLHSDDSDQVFNNPSIDAVVIGTPTFTHKELVIRALRAKKAVLCEKPLAPNHRGMAECYKLAKEMGVPLLTAFNRRFDPNFQDVHKRSQEGEVGDIRVIKTCSRDSPTPSIEYLKSSGGIFHDCACHDIDMIMWITGERPVKVTAQAHSYNEEIKAINDFDTVGILLQFPSGTMGMIDLSRLSSYGYDQRLEVFGPKGMLLGGNARPTGIMAETRQGTNQPPYFYSFASRFAEAYAQELDHFVDCVKGGHQMTEEIFLEVLTLSFYFFPGLIEVSITAQDCMASWIVSQAAEESARLGRPLYINWDENGEGTLSTEPPCSNDNNVNNVSCSVKCPLISLKNKENDKMQNGQSEDHVRNDVPFHDEMSIREDQTNGECRMCEHPMNGGLQRAGERTTKVK